MQFISRCGNFVTNEAHLLVIQPIFIHLKPVLPSFYNLFIQEFKQLTIRVYHSLAKSNTWSNHFHSISHLSILWWRHSTRGNVTNEPGFAFFYLLSVDFPPTFNKEIKSKKKYKRKRYKRFQNPTSPPLPFFMGGSTPQTWARSTGRDRATEVGQPN